MIFGDLKVRFTGSGHSDDTMVQSRIRTDIAIYPVDLASLTDQARNSSKSPRILALCENRVTRLCTVVIGTAFATDALRPTVN